MKTFLAYVGAAALITTGLVVLYWGSIVFNVLLILFFFRP